MIRRPNPWCDDRGACADDGICTRLADHTGDHFDCVTDERWHNWGDDYGRER